jgi:RNA polymerase II subunit A-like phosphatase
MWEKQDETPYLVGFRLSFATRTYVNQVELPTQNNHKNQDSHIDIDDVPDSDGTDDETADSENSDDEMDSIPRSQDEQADDEGVMPSDFEGGRSPIDDLKTFDWGSADNELAEFMGSDSENDSDTSVASDSSRGSRLSIRGRKRGHEDHTYDDDSDADQGSQLVKKQRLANSRTTGLKKVKTSNTESESEMPPPLVADEENDEEGTTEMTVDEGDLFDDLEADLEAEFEKAEAEAEAADGGG